MLFIVEVREIGGNFMTSMGEMRTWLDHKRFEPDAFRYSTGSPTTTFRLEFKVEDQAIEFAKAFGGRILGSLDHVYSAATLRRTADFTAA
jgi:hypothetical protein